MQSCCHDVILPSPHHRHPVPAPAWLPCHRLQLRSPSTGRGFVRSSVDKKPTASFRLLGAGWCWRLGRIVNSLNEYSISPRHLHKSHVTNSKQFCLTVALKLHYECPSWSVPRSFVTLTSTSTQAQVIFPPSMEMVPGPQVPMSIVRCDGRGSDGWCWCCSLLSSWQRVAVHTGCCV